MRARPAAPEDVPAIVAQYAACAEEGWILREPPVDRDAQLDRFAVVLADPSQLLLVVEHDGAVVGHGGLHPTCTEGVLTFGMGVDAAHRRRGAGGALLDAIVAAARDRGAHKLELEVWPENGGAIALYASRGFAVEGLRRDHHRRADGTLRSVLLMALAP